MGGGAEVASKQGGEEGEGRLGDEDGKKAVGGSGEGKVSEEGGSGATKVGGEEGKRVGGLVEEKGNTVSWKITSLKE